MTLDRWRRKAQRQERRPNVECLHCTCVPYTPTLITLITNTHYTHYQHSLHSLPTLITLITNTHYSFPTRGNTPPKKEEGSHARHTDTQGPTLNAYFARSRPHIECLLCTHAPHWVPTLHTRKTHRYSLILYKPGKPPQKKGGGIRNQIAPRRACLLLQGSHFICVCLFPYALVSFHMHRSLFVRIGLFSYVLVSFWKYWRGPDGFPSRYSFICMHELRFM